MPWYEEPDYLDTTWLDYDIAKDFSPDQARDDHGRWTSGGGSGAGHSSGYSAWTRSFDSRAHDKQIAQHRADEESHRAAGAKIKDQIADIKGRAKTATPKQQATLQRKTEQLKQQYEQHRTAATAARDQRRQVQQDLERARGEHTAARLAVAGARREHEADVATHEEAGGIAIGGTRIGTSHEGSAAAEEHPVEPTAPEQHYAETPDHYMGIGTGEGIRAEPEPEAAPKPKSDTPNYRTASDRQVVSYASTGPKTQEEWNAHDQKQREASEASNQSMRVRQATAEAAKPAPEPKQEPLPEARMQSPRPGLMGRLRSIFSRKMENMRKWEEDKHPRDHGKFSSSEGESGDNSHQDERLRRADAEARSNFQEDAHGPNANAAAAAWQQAERDRISAEESAHGGDARLRAAAQEAHGRHDDLVDAHHAAMAAISSERAKVDSEHEVDRAIAAGHLTSEARDIARAYVAEHQEHQRLIDAHDVELHNANLAASQALERLHPYASSEMRDEHKGLTSALNDSAAISESSTEGDRGEGANYEYHGRVSGEHITDATEMRERALAAQSALERLHQVQSAAYADLADVSSKSKRAERQATSSLDDLEDHDFVNHQGPSSHSEDEVERLGDLGAEQHANSVRQVADRPAHDVTDAVGFIRDARKQTAAAIRGLAKLTGRAADLKATNRSRKSVNSPPGKRARSLPYMASPYTKLRIKSLKFISAVDAGAQGPISNVALIKRDAKDDQSEEFTATFRVVKADEKLGLVFGWALATTLDGGKTPYVDLQKDAIIGDDALIKVAMEYMEKGAHSDVLHDDSVDGKVIFAMPITKDVAAALGIKSDVHGLAIAMKPSPATFKRFLKGELAAFSIGGIGERELVKAAPVACPSCGTYGKADAKTCKDCGAAMKRAPRPAGIAPVGKAVWSAADMDSLPDSSFLYIEGGGTKDSESKTTPRSLRHFPYKDATGKVDLDHLRNAISRIPQSSLPKDLRDKLQVRAEKLLAAQHETSKRFSKQAVLTGSVDGHAHSLDLDDPADEWRDQLSTSYQTAEGATQSHSHAWTYDPTTGAITIAEDSGHTHPIDAVVPADVRAQAALQDDGERCRSCGMMAEEGCRFCPNCGKAMGPDQSNGIPVPMADDDDSDANSGPNIVIISARAPNGGSIVKAVYADCGHEMKDGKLDCPMCAKKRATPRDSTHGIATPTTSHKEQAMATEQDNQIAALRKQLAAALALTEPERLHIAKQSPAGIEAFLAMDSAARTAAMTAADAADPEVYKTKDGLSIRKSAGQAAVAMAKQLDAQAEQLAAASEKIAKAEAQAAQVTLEKRAATELSHFAKSVGVGAAIVKALDGIADEATRKAAFEAVKGANFALAKLGIPAGADDHAGPQPDDPNGQLEALAKKHATDNKVSYAQAYDAVLLTPEGTALYKRASTPTTLRAV